MFRNKTPMYDTSVHGSDSHSQNSVWWREYSQDGMLFLHHFLQQHAPRDANKTDLLCNDRSWSVHCALSTNCSPKVPGSDRCGIPYLNKTSCRVRPGSALWYLRANLYLSAVLYTTTKTTTMTTNVTQQRLPTLQFFGLLPCKYELGLCSYWQSTAPTTHTVRIFHPHTGKLSRTI